ncbi:hypothetical protein MKW94_026093 [Papaver nudicaule]|uniref:Poly(A) RNA polymerase mitochondrial-like central palm domain-containing protein n=1 Tax=Papaver nudicaule TaxID=74823 RepID=A0AA41S7Q9_PAPNU|nr:hypothetical protein [Papaver nudicaule]
MRYNMNALQPLVRRGSGKLIKDGTVCNHVAAEVKKIAGVCQYHVDKVVAPEQIVVSRGAGIDPNCSGTHSSSSYDTNGSRALLERCLKDILKVIKPLGGDVTARYTIIDDLRTVVGSIDSLKGATVEPFGSFVSNLYTKWGDLDISVEVPCDSLVSTTDRTDKQEYLREIRKVLGRRGLVRDLRLLHARIPLLIFESNLQNISCDISISNLLCQIKSKYLFWITRIDERFRDMVLLIKEWAKSQQINDPKNGTLNSHSLCLLVIFHFQTCEPPILPPLREIYEGNIANDLTGARVIAEKTIQDTCTANIERIKTDSFRNVNRSSLCELIVSFFQKFSKLNMLASEYAICTYTGRWEHRSNSTKWANNYPLFIEDPFEHADNTARTVSVCELSRICEVFDKAYQGLVSTNHDRNSLLCSLVGHPVSTMIISPHSNPELFNRGATRYPSFKNQYNKPQYENDEPDVIAIRKELQQLMYKAQANTRNKYRSVRWLKDPR